ncbi:MAG TPA: histidine kinase dimerization/phosphoacceptor domain -containing protein [Spirochaetia bacterium]|mgnify:CR=1 FL=1|nr:histidine kinase dimerization/phosphoacceptor domain -containing protein [Spirochaetales bacterium]HQK34470.1 histidine kinase dimerization/phosphoacceptor domain -containing protein [Spirochaetales bacterium]HRS64622.1 histidine kinase dimerization/phosphoacceptor domain -containing protein [Spirochaetia bacterium]HRV28006.1 histidine kinase dimerization/phosphoacceptor domain -containing protein [Spirochaetia bacterium]
MKPKRYRTIESFILKILITALVPAFVIIVGSGIHLIQLTIQESNTHVRSQVEQFADRQNQYNKQLFSLLTTLRANVLLLYNNPEQLQQLYMNIIAEYPELANITLADSKGSVIVSSKLPRGFSVADRKYIQDALTKPGFVVGNYMKNYATGEDSIAFAESFDTNDEKRVVQAIIFIVNNYSKIMQVEQLHTGDFFGITDRDGIRLFTFPEMEIFPTGKPVPPQVWKIIKNALTTGTLIYTYPDGVKRLIAYKPLFLPSSETPYLYVFYGRSYNEFLKPVITQIILELTIFIVFLIVTVIIAVSLTRRYIAHPIYNIVKAINSVEQGDYTVRFTFNNTNTDIGRIAHALDAMTSAIAEHNKALEENQKKLEKLIAEKDILLREVHHRIKNNLQIILSLMDIELDKKSNIADFVDAIRARIISLVNVYEMVYVSGDIKKIDFKTYIESLVTFICGDLYGFPERQVMLDLDEVLITVDRALLLGLVVQELIINAIKYGVRNLEDKISISLKEKNGKYALSIQDPGIGFRLSADAMQKGAGLILVESLTKQLNAEIFWNYEHGTECRIEFS